ncbi:MAG: electron transfer flavoprotein subunit alpha/FixB family protein [Caldisphaera sp.]|nr:electron transfer flavoprotein subunit alpha/FixB family protein [Caldisphaera sp.]
MKSLIFSLNIQDARELITALKSLDVKDDDIYIALPKEVIKNKDDRRLGKVKLILLIAETPEIIVYSKEVAEVLWQFSKENDINLILFSADRLGKEVAAYVAQLSGVDHLSEAQKLYWTSEGYLGGKRSILTGKVMADEILTRRPYIATIAPKAYTWSELAEEATLLRELNIDIDKHKGMRIIKAEISKEEKINIESAKIIVSVGRGFKKKEDLELAFKLSELLGGEVGCSRPIAADLKWLSEERWIGLSGHKVKPDLYIAIGISGQSQHLAGMKDSKVAVAINADKGAPIFSNVDYGVVGDLYKVLPILIDQLNKKKKTT